MKILLVDDSAFSRKIAAQLFRENYPEAEIFLANDGAMGYESFVQIQPDILVSDLLMPNMSGQELVEKIRETDKDILIFLLTADVQQATKEEVAVFNIASFINKPLNQEKMEIVKNLTGERFA